jgi:hypothetical protein
MLGAVGSALDIAHSIHRIPILSVCATQFIDLAVAKCNRTAREITRNHDQ